MTKVFGRIPILPILPKSPKSPKLIVGYPSTTPSRIVGTSKCPAQASVPPSFPRNINFVWRAHQKSMLSQLKWGINLKGYKICISLDQVN